MKLLVYQDKLGKIYTVRSFQSLNKTEEVILNSVKTTNEKAGFERARVIDLPPVLRDVVKFLMGEDEYKTYSDIDDLDDSMNELSANISNIHEDVFEMSEAMSRIEKEFEKLKKSLETSSKR